MKNKELAAAKINLRNIILARNITIITVCTMIVQDIVFFIMYINNINNYPGEGYLGPGNFLYLIIILGAIFIPAFNFRKMINLGARRDDFLKGSVLSYIIMAAAVSLASIIVYYTYDAFLLWFYGETSWTLNILYWFGWIQRGPFIAFIQQFSFLLFCAVFIHTLTTAQDKWYGWAADILIVAIISVFTAIAPLRAALVWFFRAVIFHQSALFQIIFCLVLVIGIYALNKPMLARKAL